MSILQQILVSRRSQLGCKSLHNLCWVGTPAWSHLVQLRFGTKALDSVLQSCRMSTCRSCSSSLSLAGLLPVRRQIRRCSLGLLLRRGCFGFGSTLGVLCLTQVGLRPQDFCLEQDCIIGQRCTS